MLKESHKLVKIYKQQLKRHGHSDEVKAVMDAEVEKRDALNLTQQASPCYTCDLYKRHNQQEDRVQRLQRKLGQLNRQFEEESNLYWRQFTRHYALLKEVGFLDDNDQPTDPGQLTAKIRAENEFYMAQIVLNGLLDDLDPPQLAGVLCAVVNDSTRENLYSRLPLSHIARNRLTEIQRLGKQIYKLQQKHRLDTGMIMNPVASGLVEAWVDGAAWRTLIQGSNIDEGDLVRIIRRTADILRQLARIDEVPVKLADTAALALSRLYRAPIREERVYPAAAAPAPSPLRPTPEEDEENLDDPIFEAETGFPNP